MNKRKFYIIGNMICVVLLLCVMVTQFLPFWSCTGCANHEDGLISISEYLWNTTDHKPVTNDMTQVYKDYFGQNLKDENGKAWKFEANDVVTTPLILVICVIAGVVLMVLKPGSILPAVAACIGSAAASYGYITNLALMTGQNWMLHMVVAIVAAVTSAGFILVVIYKFIRMYI